MVILVKRISWNIFQIITYWNNNNHSVYLDGLVNKNFLTMKTYLLSQNFLKSLRNILILFRPGMGGTEPNNS